MGHVAVPWYIGGSADHPDKIARLLSYNAVGGREGVVGALDCRVLALATPGAAVRVMPGAYSILPRNHPYEMYSGMVESEDVVGTTATGSSGGRSDLVILRVENPNDFEENWNVPPDVVNGPYVFTRIIEGVPAGTKTWRELNLLGTAIAVARIDFPPNTATVTQAMITDLRPGATGAPPGDLVGTPPAAASQTIYRAYQTTATSDLPKTATTETTWPAAAVFNIAVPTWATSFAFDIDIKSVQLLNGNVRGVTALKVGSAGYSTATLFDLNYTGSPSTETVSGGGSFLVPPAIRGTTVPFTFMARMDPGYAGTLRFAPGSYLKLWMFFKAGSVLE